ncbi:MAG: hypothetical protein OXG81_01650 [Acidobacteria bacterium]|nr:hypothetical protein [Acidobacteriota bacterium]MCY3964856.1 hypothetical protein [Acidobacteriota bacterium]
MGLIARRVEADGIPTLSMTSAFSITRSVNPPRAVFLDYPLGHTTGKALDAHLQRDIMMASLAALDELDTPGAVKMLPFRWSDDDDWKREVMEGGDTRTERSAEPVYQCEADRGLAQDAGDCPTCVFL